MDAAGQTNTFTYNARGQVLTETNPKGETTTYTYDTNGYLIAVDGPLPGTNDMVTATYDVAWPDADHDRRERLHADVRVRRHGSARPKSPIPTPRSSNSPTTVWMWPWCAIARDGRRCSSIDNMRQMKKKTDPLGPGDAL